MKKFFTYVAAFLFFGTVAEAHAEWWYYETPSFYSADYPNEVNCRYSDHLSSQRTDIFNCYPEPLNSKTENVVVQYDSGEIKVETITVTNAANCNDGLCVGAWSDEFLGKLTNPRNPTKKLHALLMQEYYLHNHPATGEVYAYRKGTGPMATSFQITHIENDHNAFYNHAGVVAANDTTSQATGGQTFDLWCNPRGDFCNYTDADGVEYRLDRDELPNYIPIAEDTRDCNMEVCYDDNMDVIGLNPEYYLFR